MSASDRGGRGRKSNAEHRFGSHLSIAGGMHHAIEAARSLGFSALQVFVKNQRQWRAAPLKQEDVQAWFEARESVDLGPIVAHATYLVNLASADDGLWSKSIDGFTEELLRCDALDIAYLVVHPGAAGEQPVPQALARVADALNRIFEKHADLQVMPLLETTAGQGSSLGRSFAELGEILDQVTESERVGVCVDTCHVFAAGYDLRSDEGYAAMIAEAKKAVGLKRIRAWHLNDSKGDLGSHLDRHEHISHGKIGGAGFKRVLHDETFRGLPMVLETPKGEDDKGQDWDKRNVALLKRLAKT